MGQRKAKKCVTTLFDKLEFIVYRFLLQFYFFSMSYSLNAQSKHLDYNYKIALLYNNLSTQ